MNAPSLARIAEDLGVAMITVHGRTRCQFYKARRLARHSRRGRGGARARNANGDIVDGSSARMALEHSGAAGIMVGRAAVGRPWLWRKFKAILSVKFGRPRRRRARFDIFRAGMRIRCALRWATGCVWRASTLPALLMIFDPKPPRNGAGIFAACKNRRPSSTPCRICSCAAMKPE